MFLQIRGKNEFDFKKRKIQQLQVEIEKKRVSAPAENIQRGQREGTRRQMYFSNTKRKAVMEIRGREAASGLDGVPRIHLPPAPAPQNCS